MLKWPCWLSSSGLSQQREAAFQHLIVTGQAFRGSSKVACDDGDSVAVRVAHLSGGLRIWLFSIVGGTGAGTASLIALGPTAEVLTNAMDAMLIGPRRVVAGSTSQSSGVQMFAMNGFELVASYGRRTSSEKNRLPVAQGGPIRWSVDRPQSQSQSRRRKFAWSFWGVAYQV